MARTADVFQGNPWIPVMLISRFGAFRIGGFSEKLCACIKQKDTQTHTGRALKTLEPDIDREDVRGCSSQFACQNGCPNEVRTEGGIHPRMYAESRLDYTRNRSHTTLRLHSESLSNSTQNLSQNALRTLSQCTQNPSKNPPQDARRIPLRTRSRMHPDSLLKSLSECTPACTQTYYFGDAFGISPVSG